MFGCKKIVGNRALGSFLWDKRLIFSGIQDKYGSIIKARRNTDIVIGNRNSKCSVGTRNYACEDPCSYTRWMDISCKTALVTGGATGIGLAIADALLSMDLKKAYISGINDNDGVKAVQSMAIKHGEGKCEYIHLDVNNHKQFEDAFRDIICKEGSVDILVNNAGMLNDKKWELEIDTNVKGVMRGILLANKYMPNQKNKGGCVVNVASILGFDGFPYAPGYNCTKHAVIGLTKSFGDPVHYKKNGVRHIALGPGVTHTELVHESAPRQLEADWGQKTLEALNSLPSQTTEVVGRGTTYMIEYAPPGSLWVIEDCKLQRVIPPNRKTYQTKVLDL